MKGHRYWVAVVFFLIAAAPGAWFPALSNTLDNYDLGAWKTLIFTIPPITGMISPLIFGAQADQRWQAQKVLGWIMLLGAVFLFMAFYAMEQGWGPGWFLFYFSINALISAPAWSLITTITLSSLPDPGKTFGYFRVWGTLGWMSGLFTVSYFGWDFLAMNGQFAAVVRVFAGVACFFLPVTLPKGQISKNWYDALGLGAMKLLRDRDLFVYFMTVLCFSIPLGAFYMHTPQHLRELGVQHTSYYMMTGQILETVSMLGMGYVIGRFRVKSILLIAIGCGVLRYTFYGVDSKAWIVAGIVLHGVCWTFFFEAGRVFVHRRVEEGMRGQAQALMGFFSGGLGGVLGILTVNAIYQAIKPDYGWSAYWLILTGLNLIVAIFFTIGYRGLPAPPQASR